MSTSPGSGDATLNNWNAIREINEHITNTFAVSDQDYWFIKRKKIQKVYEISTKICYYKNFSLAAEVYYREYICEKVENGKKVYPLEKFHNDISAFVKETDSFKDTGEPFACYLDKAVREMNCFISKPKEDN